ncbi:MULTISPECIES: hypothetical protein [Emticicia]|uniref:hypothetical protein n=1 Tax=Emticicia TaxID=312278 RepID=UPI0007D8A78D|nr:MULTISPECIES: hypothetical protein [Emticicia]
MTKFLGKIPLIIYSIIIVGFSIYLTRQIEVYLIKVNWLTQNEGEARVALYSSVLTVIAIFYGVMQLQSQTKDSLFANEYINQPEFEFYAYCSKTNLLEDDASPGCCCETGKVCTNNCVDEHWFNLKQIGNLPATDIKISMFHSKESDDVCCAKKVLKTDTLNKNAVYQYKLPPYSFSTKLFDQTTNGSFYVLISYKSLYSNLKYKRVYELEYSPKPDPELKDGLWGDNIKFFSAQLIKITDYNSLRLRDIILGSVVFYLYKLKIINTYKIENWILKY